MKRLLMFLSPLLLLLGFALGSQAAPPSTQPNVAQPKFLVGVWYQPTYLFDTWKARGINTLVGCDPVDFAGRELWKKTAREKGLFYILKPVVGHEDWDANDPYLLAWSLQDEPDGVGNTPPEPIKTEYARLKKLHPEIPVFLNFDGHKTPWRPANDYVEYCKGADWLGMDYYPCNLGEPQLFAQIGSYVDFIKKAGPGKPVFSFIECSDQNMRVQQWAQGNDGTGTPLAPKMRGPTAFEVEQQSRLAIAHGVSGIFYFPDVIGQGWQAYDGTLADVSDRMTTLNTEFSKLTSPVALFQWPPGNVIVLPTTLPTTVPVVPPVVVAPGPTTQSSIILDFDGVNVNINGVPYVLRRK